MSRLTRIVCDNPDCRAQVEVFADEFYRRLDYTGMSTPEGWYCLIHRPVGHEQSVEAPQPLYFCSIPCVRNATGEAKAPQDIHTRPL